MDTNVIIDFLSLSLPKSAESFIERQEPVISIITRLEVMGWYKASPAQIERLKPFIDGALTLALTEAVALKTIEIRQNYKIKLPDAIIAATALANQLTLLSRNMPDFKSIENLVVLNPWEL